MKTQLTTLHDGSRTCEMTKPVSGRKLVLALLMRLLGAAALALPVFGTQAAVVFTSLHSFQVFPNGANPAAALVQGRDGDFYGTTYGGGTNGGYGTVFKISTNGALTSLYSFTGGTDGANPSAALVQGSDGNFYGTTYDGGTNNAGTVFKISATGALTSLHSFTGGNEGANPQAGLVQGPDGNFYGTAQFGGTNNAGTVFKISANGALTSLYFFTGGTTNGANPYAGLVQGSDGNFYGTTQYGGTSNAGTVFKISANGALNTLHFFTGGNDGGAPLAGLVQGRDGNFYGTTVGGGSNYSAGTVFKISATGALATLYSFTGGNDGAVPSFGLVQGNDGNFYGTTAVGGKNGAGTVFKISATGVLTSLYSFSGGTDGADPQGGLVQGRDGNFYGTTYNGGTNNVGTVFKISATGALTRLYSFTGGGDGAVPVAGLAQGSNGNFYGTTYYGGTNNAGTVFEISTDGALTTLYSFTGGNDGAGPYAGVVQGNDGNFYGTTRFGGTNSGYYQSYGTVFRISTNGTLTSLYSFGSAWDTNGLSLDGVDPIAGLVQGSDGNFYGTTANNQYCTGPFGSRVPCGPGTVFKISSNGALTTLHSFTGGNDGSSCFAGLVQGRDGNFYGTTSGGGANYSGTVYKISSIGELASLYSFTGGTDGATPVAALVQGNDGNFYGTTSGGGYTNLNSGYGYGTVFKISATGALTTLYSFTGGNDGAGPQAGLVQGRDGNFYGTTGGGKTNNNYPYGAGTVFKISSDGALTTLYSFTGGNDGAGPNGLVQGSDGSFYGTTQYGGQVGAGTVFRLTVLAPAAPLFQAVTLTNITLSLIWSTEAGGAYQLQYKSDLLASNWTNLGGAVTATGATLSALDSITNGPRRFYRVMLSP